jgi:hypothetical protein
MPVFCAALRLCSTLTHLHFELQAHNGTNRRIVTDLLDAAAALPALSELNLSNSQLQDAVAAGRAFGALLGANLPSLRILSVAYCQLDDEAMAALLDGLAANTHLRELEWTGYHLSDAFHRDRMVPAQAALAARAELDS